MKENYDSYAEGKVGGKIQQTFPQELKNKSLRKSIWLTILEISSTFMMLYVCLALLLHSIQIIFRGWVNLLALIMGTCMVIAVLVLLTKWIKKKTYQVRQFSLIKGITYIVSGLMISFIILVSVFLGMISYSPEHNLGDVIAKVNMNFLHTRVDYYHPATIFCLRYESTSPSVKGSFDPYDEAHKNSEQTKRLR